MSLQEAYVAHFKPDSAPSNWEVWAWFFMRISGLMLVFLLLGHMAIMHVFGGGVSRVNFQFVAKRWNNFFWRSYDWLLLTLALLHGVNGARVVIEDYVKRGGLRVSLKGLLYSATFVFYSIGSLVIFTFSASQMPGGK
ncbi:MAG: succinate dehydrogenase [Actinomycetota bacterium]|nr:succinate dehydrogenase [Actinomycetota bacterium]